MEAISKQPNLQSVTLPDSLLRAPALTTLVHKAQGLKVLTLKRIVLQGLKRDLDDLETALYQHTFMKAFSMMDCKSPNELDLARVERAGSVSRGHGSNPATINVSGSAANEGAIAA